MLKNEILLLRGSASHAPFWEHLGSLLLLFLSAQHAESILWLWNLFHSQGTDLDSDFPTFSLLHTLLKVLLWLLKPWHLAMAAKSQGINHILSPASVESWGRKLLLYLPELVAAATSSLSFIYPRWPNKGEDFCFERSASFLVFMKCNEQKETEK